MRLITLTPRRSKDKFFKVNTDKIAIVKAAPEPEGGSYVVLDMPGLADPIYVIETVESPESIEKLIDTACAAGRW